MSWWWDNSADYGLLTAQRLHAGEPCWTKGGSCSRVPRECERKSQWQIQDGALQTCYWLCHLFFLQQLIDKLKIHYSLEIIQEVQVQNLKPAMVKMYDYYQPGKTDKTQSCSPFSIHTYWLLTEFEFSITSAYWTIQILKFFVWCTLE